MSDILMILVYYFSDFIKAYVVGTHLNCTNLMDNSNKYLQHMFL